MDRFITVLCPQNQMEADLVTMTLEEMHIPVILSYDEDEQNVRNFRIMVPERYHGRAVVAAQGLACASFSSKSERGKRFSSFIVPAAQR